MKRAREDEDAGPLGKKSVGDVTSEEKRERLTTHDALSYLREVKNQFANNRRVYDSFLEIMKQFKAQRIDTAGVILKVKDLFRGHPDLILGFNTFLPKGYEIRLDDDAAPSRGGAGAGAGWAAQGSRSAAAPSAAGPSAPKAPVEFDQAISYVNKIKQRFAADERVYKAFLEILNMYRKGQKSIGSVYEEVALLFRNHEDLLQEFTYFLPDSGPPAGGRGRVGGYAGGRKGVYGASAAQSSRHARKGPPPLRKDDPRVQRELAFFDKVQQRLHSKEAYTDFLKCLNLFAEDVISKPELVALVHDIIGKHSDLLAGFNEFLMRCELGPEDAHGRAYARSERSRHASAVEKYIRMSISELDVSTWERCTPSYVQLPANYPKLSTTGRDAFGQSFLNDGWVSVTSGSEDYSFKHYRKNQYEEALFRAEDDHFEMDMVMDQNASAIRALTPVAAALESATEEERGSYRLEPGTLRAFHNRAVQRIYGEQGPGMVSLLHQAPGVAVPVILARLVQKDQEWRAARQQLMTVWQQIFRDNYHKSLDHRSFYFKQGEKKALNAKTMVAEVREAAEKRRGDPAAVAAAVGCGGWGASRLGPPHARFDAAEAGTHADVGFVLQLGIDNLLTADHAARARRFFHDVLETLFQVACTCEAAAIRRAAEPDGGVMNNSNASHPRGLLTTSAGLKPRGGRGRGRGRGRRHHHAVACRAAVSAEMSTGGEEEEDETTNTGGGGLLLVEGSSATEGEEGTTARSDGEEEEVERGLARRRAGVKRSNDEEEEEEEEQPNGGGVRGRKSVDDITTTTTTSTTTDEEEEGDTTSEAAVTSEAVEEGTSRLPDDEETAVTSGESASRAAALLRCRPVWPLVRNNGDEKEEPTVGGLSYSKEAKLVSSTTNGDNAAATMDQVTKEEQQQQASSATQFVAAPTTPQPSLHCHCHVLYANEPLYVLLRLYCLLYERLRTARQSAVSSTSGVSTAVGPSGPSPEGASWTPAAASLHGEFLTLARRVIEGRMEPGAYEDATRSLLGTNSYQLFTLDKVVARAVKQLQTVSGDELAGRLAELWRYECARGRANDDGVYFANARLLLHEEPAFRVSVSSSGELGVHLVEADRLELGAGTLDPGFRAYVDAYVADAAHHGHIRAFATERTNIEDSNREDEEEDVPASLCLRRNLQRAQRGPPKQQSLVNGLECKLCCVAQRAKKVAYVLGTEDCFFHTPRRATATWEDEQRRSKFRTWVEMRSSEADIIVEGTQEEAAVVHDSSQAMDVDAVTADNTAASDIEHVAALLTAAETVQQQE